MRISTHRNFERQVKKLRVSEQRRLIQRLELFRADPNSPILNNHALKGRGEGHFSINITGDIRAIYRLPQKDVALFLKVDTHSNLYS